MCAAIIQTIILVKSLGIALSLVLTQFFTRKKGITFIRVNGVEIHNSWHNCAP